jgi:hypothetical protein
MRRFGFLAFALAIFAAQTAMASTISYLGVDSTTGAGWRSTNVAKTAAYDPNGDNAYGSDGYYFLKTAGCGTADSSVVESVLPSYFSSVTAPLTQLAYGTWCGGQYAAVNNPTLPISGTVTNLSGNSVTLWQATKSTSTTFFTITLGEDATFILTVIVGTHNVAGYNTKTITLANSLDATDTVTTDVSSYTNVTSGNADYVFYKISGVEGETITISMTSNGAQSSCAGIAFETVVPEPATTVMALTGIAGLLAFAWRKRKNGR